MKKIHVPPLRWYEHVFDWLMIPVMYLIAGTLRETPQRTHRWNNKKLRRAEVRHLLQLFMVLSSCLPTRTRWFWKIPLFHMPILGGWKHYVVLEPSHLTGAMWHVGWVAGDVIGVSRVTLTGPVRVLVGDGDVSHFGLDAEGRQIPIRRIGVGTIGAGGPFAWTPLL